jgi:hypothetical protein
MTNEQATRLIEQKIVGLMNEGMQLSAITEHLTSQVNSANASYADKQRTLKLYNKVIASLHAPVTETV